MKKKLSFLPFIVVTTLFMKQISYRRCMWTSRASGSYKPFRGGYRRWGCDILLSQISRMSGRFILSAKVKRSRSSFCRSMQIKNRL